MTQPKHRTMVNGFDPDNLVLLDDAKRSMIERRQRLLGPAYRLFYQDPVEVARGEGVFLYDRDGNEYLDAYNNVVSVGHANAFVADAISKQLHTLSTHTRYLQDNILDYAATLLPSFGGRIGDTGHLMFTCTGSEANDLALRIAQYQTGRKGIIITSEAYHGNSHLTAGISPSLGARSPLGPWVRQVPAPDSYRRQEDGMAQWFAANVAAQVHDLERHGEGLAAFIVDSAFSSDGIFGEPTDVLRAAAQVVRDAGGLFIADEVQSGFARTGDDMWGYRRHGIDPDIVTMGKPMGNGFPVAALAIAPEIISRFGQDLRYFNTFGGNTVAIAAAQATLNYIVNNEILQNVHDVGMFIRSGLRDVAADFEEIGDIRGPGLYIGVEIVTDRASKTPDDSLATALVNGLRQRRILVSSTGPHGNVIKIRPPLIFNRDHATRLIEQFAAVMHDLGSGGSRVGV